MTKIQNLNYYIHFFTSVKDVQKQYEQPGLLRSLMSPLDRTTRVASSLFADYFAFPIVKGTYKTVGIAATQFTKFINASLSKWIKESWDDPISTKTLLKIGEKIENLTKATAGTTPTEWPILQAMDKCRIEIARHFYIMAKDFNSLLRIPGALHNYVNWTTIDTDSNREGPITLSQKGWFFFQKGTKAISDAMMALIAKVIEVAAIPLDKLPYLEGAVNWIGQKIDEARNHIHKSIIKRAHNVIDHHEVAIRKSVIGKIGEISTRTLLNEALNIGIKFYLSRGIYQLTKYCFSQVTGLQEIPEEVETLASVALKIAGFTLLMHLAASTVERFCEDYKQDFDTEASTLHELSLLVQHHNLPKILPFIHSHF